MASSDAGTYVLEVKTVQSQAFKILVECLKELLTDTTIDFDETGLKIVSMDTNHCVLAHCKLQADKFEFFYCKNKISVGVNFINLYKIIRTINSNDTLTLFVEANDPNHLGIKIENGEKNSKTTYKLNLLDLDSQSIHIDNAEFNTAINLPSVDFQKWCRDMHNIAEMVEIKNIGNQLFLSCKGDFCNQETVIVDNENGSGANINCKKGAGEIVQGVFNLKYLVLFSKCSNLCSTVEILLKNDYPIVVRYLVASLGSVSLCLAPSTSEL